MDNKKEFFDELLDIIEDIEVTNDKGINDDDRVKLINQMVDTLCEDGVLTRGEVVNILKKHIKPDYKKLINLISGYN